jgi:hypothetical protein
MFVNPNLSGQLARDCHRELLTQAEQRRLSRQLRATPDHRARGVVMAIAARLRRAARVLTPAAPIRPA